jgi:HSP20 family molecular chaperone IbpA
MELLQKRLRLPNLVTRKRGLQKANSQAMSGAFLGVKYERLRPLYTEYNIGNYRRSFALSNKIEQNSIKAELKDGVMSLLLPKADKEKAKSRKITVS